MKKGTLKKITILDNYGNEKKVIASFLGKGSFATCYVYDGYVYSFVKNGKNESDFSKEAIALFANDSNAYIPNFETLGDYGDYDGILYKSPLYSPLTPEYKTAWKEFRILESIWKNASHDKTGYEFNNCIIDILREKVSDELIEALESINSACSSYGDEYYFEFNKRNMAVDENGNLILLDIIFNKQALRYMQR